MDDVDGSNPRTVFRAEAVGKAAKATSEVRTALETLMFFFSLLCRIKIVICVCPLTRVCGTSSGTTMDTHRCDQKITRVFYFGSPNVNFVSRKFYFVKLVQRSRASQIEKLPSAKFSNLLDINHHKKTVTTTMYYLQQGEARWHRCF